MKKHIDVYLENLSLLKLVALLSTKSVKTHLFHYSTQTKVARFFNRLLKRIGINAFATLDYSQFSRKLENGASLRYKVEILTSKTVNDWLSCYGADNLVSPYDSCDLEWKQIVKSFLTLEIRKKSEFIYLIDNSFNKNPLRKTEIIIDAFPLSSYLISRLQLSQTTTVKIWPHWKQQLLLFPFPGYALYGVLWSIYSVLRIKNPQHNMQLPDDKARVFEEYISNIFSRYPQAGHLFWFPSSHIDPKRVVLYFDRTDSRCTESATQQIQRYNMKWIDLQQRLNHGISPSAFLNKTSKLLFPRKWNQEQIGLWSIQVYFIHWIEWYRNLLKTYNVRIVHQHRECLPLPLCLALATRLEDGIFIWNHWSVDHYPISSFDTGFADLVFSWGPYNDGYFNCHQYHYRYMLQTGLVAGDNIDSGDTQKGMEIRKAFPAEIKFVIAVFDSSHQLNTVFSTTEMMIFFYEHVLTLIKNKPEWGVVIKSKGISFQRVEAQPSIRDLVKHLMEKQQCIVLDGHSRVVTAACAADACLCFDINSAGILSAMAEKKTIHWDISGAIKHPFYYLGCEGKIIFKSFEEVRNALAAIAKGDTEIGDHANWLPLIDPFRDGQGPERAGKVVADFLHAIDSGHSRDESLKIAVQAFSDRWGNDKVSTTTNITDHEGNRIWQQVRNDSQTLLT